MKEAIVGISENVIQARNISGNAIVAFAIHDNLDDGTNVFVLSTSPSSKLDERRYYWMELAMNNYYNTEFSSVSDAIKWANKSLNVHVYVFDTDRVDFGKWVASVVA